MSKDVCIGEQNKRKTTIKETQYTLRIYSYSRYYKDIHENLLFDVAYYDK